MQPISYDASTGWCAGVERHESPNFNDRPAAVMPSLLVVHNISLPPGEFAGDYVIDFFQNKLDVATHEYFNTISDLKVSSHFFVRRSGVVVQFVSCLSRAWHAGVSQFDGQENCNDFSIGIEMEGADDIPYTANQYRRLSELIEAMRRGLPSLVSAPIVGHSDIAPNRKTDPGEAFDWLRLHTCLSMPR